MIEKLKPERIIDICEISYFAFYINFKYFKIPYSYKDNKNRVFLNFKYFKNTLFLLSLYELDCELADRKQGQESKVEELDLIN